MVYDKRSLLLYIWVAPEEAHMYLPHNMDFFISHDANFSSQNDEDKAWLLGAKVDDDPLLQTYRKEAIDLFFYAMSWDIGAWPFRM
jgi:hypothetical protein